jgi:hypothetical protein
MKAAYLLYPFLVFIFSSGSAGKEERFANKKAVLSSVEKHQQELIHSDQIWNMLKLR